MAKISGIIGQAMGAPESDTQRTDKADWSEVLAEVPLFQGLSKRHVRGIAKLAKVMRLAPFSQIVREGEPADSFFLILDGTALARPPGKRAVKLGVGDFFGELALLDNSPRSATVEAQDEVLLARIGAKDFLKLLEKEPKVSLVLLKTLAVRLRSSEPSPKH